MGRKEKQLLRLIRINFGIIGLRNDLWNQEKTAIVVGGVFQTIFKTYGALNRIFPQYVKISGHVQQRGYAGSIEFIEFFYKPDHLFEIFPDICLLLIIEFKPCQVSEVFNHFVVHFHENKNNKKLLYLYLRRPFEERRFP